MIRLVLYFLASVSSYTIPTTIPSSTNTIKCEQYSIDIQPDILQNSKGKFKCIEQDHSNRCEDILNSKDDAPHLSQLRNQTFEISVCVSPGSSCLACQDSTVPHHLQPVCTQRLREKELFVLKASGEGWELDTFLVPGGCQCSKRNR